MAELERRRPNFQFKPASESECARAEEEFTHVFADITKDAQFREKKGACAFLLFLQFLNLRGISDP